MTASDLYVTECAIVETIDELLDEYVGANWVETGPGAGFLTTTFAEHAAPDIVDALASAGYVVVPAARIADLERKNATLGRLAAGGAPEGYALVKEETA